MTMFRTQGSVSSDNDALVEEQVVTEPVAAEEQQQHGISSEDANEHDRYRNANIIFYKTVNILN
jgi:hypothetical protein